MKSQTPQTRTPKVLLFLFVFIALLVSACGSSSDSSSVTSLLPTPNVPDSAIMNDARARWDASDNQRYFLEVEEITDAGTSVFRIVVVDGEVTAAQRLDNINREWAPPVAIDFETAAQYTVDALFDRIMQDASGEGSAPFDMIAAFDNTSGYPILVEAKPLPSITENGEMAMNRDKGYLIGLNLGLLIEDITALGKEPLITLNRSGGTDAWCSTLRILPDGTSVYNDNCRQTLLQLRPPSADVAALAELVAEYSMVENTRGTDGTEQLIFGGTGSTPASPEVIDQIWSLATSLNELLSKPIGAGITLLYQQGNNLFGFDMRTMLAQPASLIVDGILYGASTDPTGNLLVYADDGGLNWLDTITAAEGKFFSSPDGTYYQPRVWFNKNSLLLNQVTPSGLEWGWTETEQKAWTALPQLSGAWGCDAGLDGHPSEAIIVIASSNEDCGTAPGLWLLDIANDTMTQLIEGAAASPSFSSDGAQIAFASTDENGVTNIMVVATDGGEPTPVTLTTEGRATSPIWAKDGQGLYIGLQDTDIATENGIYVYDFSDGSLTQIVPGENLTPLSMAPTFEFIAFDANGDLNVWFFSFNQVFPVTGTFPGAEPAVSGWLDARAPTDE